VDLHGHSLPWCVCAALHTGKVNTVNLKLLLLGKAYSPLTIISIYITLQVKAWSLYWTLRETWESLLCVTMYYNRLELMLCLHFSNFSLGCFIFIQLFRIFPAIIEWKPSWPLLQKLVSESCP
jgi:hypothetical protein